MGKLEAKERKRSGSRNSKEPPAAKAPKPPPASLNSSTNANLIAPLKAAPTKSKSGNESGGGVNNRLLCMVQDQYNTTEPWQKEDNDKVEQAPAAPDKCSPERASSASDSAAAPPTPPAKVKDDEAESGDSSASESQEKQSKQKKKAKKSKKVKEKKEK